MKIRSLFSTRRIPRSFEPIIRDINSREDQASQLTDQDLRSGRYNFRRRLHEGATFDDLLPESFALVREASKRTLNLRHYDVQLAGGIALHRGTIAEMETGEGKTLVATLAAYLNGLNGQGVHVVTVNDYLAARDAQWMGPIYEALGMSVGVVDSTTTGPDRYKAYRADITYCTSRELGFDYLRDNLARQAVLSRAEELPFSEVLLGEKPDPAAAAQRSHHFAIVDEVDSVLIDQARTPMVISGMERESEKRPIYLKADELAGTFQRGRDYKILSKERRIELSDEGKKRAGREGIDSGIKLGRHERWSDYLIRALAVRYVYKRDVNYAVIEGRLVLIDETTGRLMPGRTLPDGLHQAIQTREGLRITAETRSRARVVFQQYFRRYTKLAGMTGTAQSSAAEFRHIYHLPIVSLPTHRPLHRTALPDAVYRCRKDKWRAICEEIEKKHLIGQPVLVGTYSVDASEQLAEMLRRRSLDPAVLNAKNHTAEAEIIARAGQRGRITIATNMAGRGVDIVLGEGVNSRGGLHIIGAERADDRRIDNQLAGRCGRHGEPGSYQYIVSLQDDLVRMLIPAKKKASNIRRKTRALRGRPVPATMVNGFFESIQRRITRYYYQVRQNLMQREDWLNKAWSGMYGYGRPKAGPQQGGF